MLHDEERFGYFCKLPAERFGIIRKVPFRPPQNAIEDHAVPRQEAQSVFLAHAIDAAVDLPEDLHPHSCLQKERALYSVKAALKLRGSGSLLRESGSKTPRGEPLILHGAIAWFHIL